MEGAMEKAQHVMQAGHTFPLLAPSPAIIDPTWPLTC